MKHSISENHPLRRLFTSLAEAVFFKKLQWPDLPVVRYVADLLIDFTHVDHYYRIRNMKGRPFKEVAGMLLESDILLNAGSFEREREVHRHIGDFTLFTLGIFPEYIKRIKGPAHISHPDFLIDYIKVGKHSYRNVSEFNYGEYRQAVSLFRKLSENFELCVTGLGFIKEGIYRLPESEIGPAKRLLLN